jgi:hypothetical protein
LPEISVWDVGVLASHPRFSWNQLYGWTQSVDPRVRPSRFGQLDGAERETHGGIRNGEKHTSGDKKIDVPFSAEEGLY